MTAYLTGNSLSLGISRISSGFLVEDVNSERARPNRGYHDYNRRLTVWGFAKIKIDALAAEQLADVTKPLYMWQREVSRITYVVGDVTFTEILINYGYDSGD